MAKHGDINVIIYRGDRQLWKGGQVRLRLLDPFSQTEKILVDHQVGPKVSTVRLEKAPADRGQNYSLIATARGFRDAAIYPVKPRPGGLSHAAVMLVRKDAKPDFSTFSFERLKEFSPAFEAALQAGGISEADFTGLEPELQAAALNIEAKLRATKLGGFEAVEYVKKISSVNDIHQDRIFCRVKPEMVEDVRFEIRENKTFQEVPEWANELFHAGFPISFKQRIPFGSLQLSFAREPDNDGLLDADIDIDLLTDVGHFGEVLRNKLTGQKTDSYTVYVQLFDQRIFPLYTIQS